jgi:hypothetical protein
VPGDWIKEGLTTTARGKKRDRMRLAFPMTKHCASVAGRREMAKQPTSDGGSLQDFIAAADESVKKDFAGGKGLRDFLATIDKLTPQEKSLMVEQAIKLLEGFYVHLPLKRAMHAVDPLQSLRLLQRRQGLLGNRRAA